MPQIRVSTICEYFSHFLGISKSHNLIYLKLILDSSSIYLLYAGHGYSLKYVNEVILNTIKILLHQNLSARNYIYHREYGTSWPTDFFVSYIMNGMDLCHCWLTGMVKNFMHHNTLQPLYNTLRYNTVLYITRFKDGSQKCVDYIEKWP